MIKKKKKKQNNNQNNMKIKESNSVGRTWPGWQGAGGQTEIEGHAIRVLGPINMRLQVASFGVCDRELEHARFI